MLTGTWIHPKGTRVDVARDEEGWRSTVYLFRGTRAPVGGGLIGTTPEAAREKIEAIEAQGYVRVESP